MPKAAELKKGQIVQINNQPYIVSQIDIKSPSSRSGTTLYKIRFNHVQSGQKLEQSLTGDDMLATIDFQKRAIQFLYQDADGYTFMDNEDFSQFTLNPFQPTGTLTSNLVTNMGEAVGNFRAALFAQALVLLILSMVLILCIRLITRRKEG